MACSLVAVFIGVGASAQNYEPRSVWLVSEVKTRPGEFEKYMAWLANTWRSVEELAKRQGVVVSYHVLNRVTNPRRDEPNIILLINYKDFQTLKQQQLLQADIDRLLAQNTAQQDVASGNREETRELLGSEYYLELELK